MRRCKNQNDCPDREHGATQRLPEGALYECHLVLPVIAIAEDLCLFAQRSQHPKKNFGSNLPEINHSQQNMIAHPIISVAHFFFRASILPATKKKLTARMRVLAATSFELPRWSGLQHQ
jgi:hypothetical protein